MNNDLNNNISVTYIWDYLLTVSSVFALHINSSINQLKSNSYSDAVLSFSE